MARRHSDSARELAHDEESDDALDVAEHANRFVELLTRPGIPPDIAAALYEPPDPDNWTPPPRLPHDRDLTISWIGRTHLGEQLEEAIQILGGQALWCILGFLERIDTPPPTASLAGKIERHRITLEVIAETCDGIDEDSSRALQSLRPALFLTVALSRKAANDGRDAARPPSQRR